MNKDENILQTFESKIVPIIKTTYTPKPEAIKALEDSIKRGKNL